MVWLWPENVPHWHAWQCCQTQWRYATAGMGAAQPIGLDYAACAAYLQHALGYHPRRRGTRSLSAAMQSLRVCEAGALEGFAQARVTQPKR